MVVLENLERAKKLNEHLAAVKKGASLDEKIEITALVEIDEKIVIAALPSLLIGATIDNDFVISVPATCSRWHRIGVSLGSVDELAKELLQRGIRTIRYTRASQNALDYYKTRDMKYLP